MNKVQSANLKFAIILPTINRPSLDTAIHSVWNQEYNNWHLYVIDDTKNYERLLENNMNTKTTRLCCNGPHNDSGTYARNLGIKVSAEEWIAYIDCDDEWLPNHLTTLVECARLNPDANMLKTAGQQFKMSHRHPRSSKLIRKMGPINSTDILTVGMAHQRILFNKTTGWGLGTAHDRDLWNKMLNVGGIPIVSDVVTFHFAR